MSTNQDYVKIFDTTLRDGEQSPGISLNAQEKLEIAPQPERPRADIIINTNLSVMMTLRISPALLKQSISSVQNRILGFILENNTENL